jgi:hypothetical protein
LREVFAAFTVPAQAAFSTDPSPLDRFIVAISGAHTIGRAWRQNGFGVDGNFDGTATSFDNRYHMQLNEDGDRRLQGLPPPPGNNGLPPGNNGLRLATDQALVDDAQFRPYVQTYATDQTTFLNDFAMAFAAMAVVGHSVPPEMSLTEVTGAVENAHRCPSALVSHAVQRPLAIRAFPGIVMVAIVGRLFL